MMVIMSARPIKLEVSPHRPKALEFFCFVSGREEFSSNSKGKYIS